MFSVCFVLGLVTELALPGISQNYLAGIIFGGIIRESLPWLISECVPWRSRLRPTLGAAVVWSAPMIVLFAGYSESELSVYVRFDERVGWGWGRVSWV